MLQQQNSGRYMEHCLNKIAHEQETIAHGPEKVLFRRVKTALSPSENLLRLLKTLLRPVKTSLRPPLIAHGLEKIAPSREKGHLRAVKPGLGL